MSKDAKQMGGLCPKYSKVAGKGCERTNNYKPSRGPIGLGPTPSMTMTLGSAQVQLYPNLELDPGDFKFLLFTKLLTPKLLASTTSAYTQRVVYVSSYAHKFGKGVNFDTLGNPDPAQYDIGDAYAAQTKSVAILTAIELSRRSKGMINAYSLHPGAIFTNVNQRQESKEHMISVVRSAMSWLFHTTVQLLCGILLLAVCAGGTSIEDPTTLVGFKKTPSLIRRGWRKRELRPKYSAHLAYAAAGASYPSTAMRFVARDPEPILMLERLEDLVHDVVCVPVPEQNEQIIEISFGSEDDCLEALASWGFSSNFHVRDLAWCLQCGGRGDIQGHGQFLRAFLTAQSIPHQPFHKKLVGLLDFWIFLPQKKSVVRSAESSIMAIIEKKKSSAEEQGRSD
ncbi:hypothetical protein C8J57DRAFT_1486170, partial [Mycena rebaudengoi]